MEAVGDVPVNLSLSILNPESFYQFFRYSEILALGRDHFCPTTINGGWLTLGIKRWPGEDAKIIAQCFLNPRHGPETAPLHSTELLREGSRVPPEGRRIW